jgi:hypothetical protein
VHNLEAGVSQVLGPVIRRQRLARADGDSEEAFGIFVQLATHDGRDFLGPYGLDERQVPAGLEQGLSVRKDLRQVHLEEYALCNDRIVRLLRSMAQKGLTSSMDAEPAPEFPKEYLIRLDRGDVPSKSSHSCGGITNAGAHFENTVDISFAKPLKNPLGCRRAAGMQIAHSQLCAKLMVLKQNSSWWLARSARPRYFALGRLRCSRTCAHVAPDCGAIGA